jgi:hypothetical protein
MRFVLSNWGSEVEVERRNRIRLTLAAYAYEFDDNPIMSDAEFDELSQAIRPEIETGMKKHDEFFSKHFDPNTGMWIRQHPFLRKVEHTYRWNLSKGYYK